MLYSVYSKWVISEDMEIDYDTKQIFGNWILVGNNLTPTQVMEILTTCHASPHEDDYIQIVLPELEIGDHVLNIKDNRVGTVLYFDQNPVGRFDEIYTDDEGLPIDNSFEFVTVESEGENITWEMKNLIVVKKD